MGMGQPQYRWRDTPQSRILYVVVFSPSFNSCNLSVHSLMASEIFKPFKKSELI